MCQHTKCPECKIGKPTSLQAVHEWKNILFEEDEGVGNGWDTESDGEVDKGSVSLIWEAEGVV